VPTVPLFKHCSNCGAVMEITDRNLVLRGSVSSTICTVYKCPNCGKIELWGKGK